MFSRVYGPICKVSFFLLSQCFSSFSLLFFDFCLVKDNSQSVRFSGLSCWLFSAQPWSISIFDVFFFCFYFLSLNSNTFFFFWLMFILFFYFVMWKWNSVNINLKDNERGVSLVLPLTQYFYCPHFSIVKAIFYWNSSLILFGTTILDGIVRMRQFSYFFFM